MSKKIMNICFGRERQDSDKKSWSNHGIVLFSTDDEGNEPISIKLNSLPIDKDFDGWLSVFEQTDRDVKSSDASNEVEF